MVAESRINDSYKDDWHKISFFFFFFALCSTELQVRHLELSHKPKTFPKDNFCYYMLHDVSTGSSSVLKYKFCDNTF